MVCQHQWFWSENQSAPSDPREVTPAGGSWWIIPLQQALDSFIYVIIIIITALCCFMRKSLQQGQTRFKPQCSRDVYLPASGSLKLWKEHLVNLITIWRIISSPVCTGVLLLVKQPAGCGHWWQPEHWWANSCLVRFSQSLLDSVVLLISIQTLILIASTWSNCNKASKMAPRLFFGWVGFVFFVFSVCTGWLKRQHDI